MNKLTLLSLVVVLSACGGSEKTKVVSDFWKGMATNDQALLESVLDDKSSAEFLAKGKSTQVDYEVLDELENGVNVKFSRFCYDDAIVPTYVKEVDGEVKVDFRATLKAQMKLMKTAKTNRKYCYDFEDKPLSGVLNGQSWSLVNVHSQKVDWGGEVSTRTKLYGEECDVTSYGACKSASLIISNLDLSGDGGNFDGSNNITIHVPPGDNLIVSSGSYRVSRVDNRRKIELSFKYDSDNYLNGYALYVDD